MRIELEVPADPELLSAALEGLVAVNLALMDRQEFPPLYRSGVRYRRERRTERWKNIRQIFLALFGDCEDLSAWRVAELRRAGELGAFCEVVKVGPSLWHVRVRREDGRIEDPSRRLGMGRKKR